MLINLESKFSLLTGALLVFVTALMLTRLHATVLQTRNS